MWEEAPDRLWKTPPATFEEVFERLNLKWLLEDNPVPFRKGKREDEKEEKRGS